MPEPVHVGVIGTSGYTEAMHLTNIASHPGARISAICGRNTARAQALVVSSPDDLHCAMTMDTLDAGLHVICEKPMAMTVEQAHTMYWRAVSAGVKHMIYFTWRWLPITRAVRRLIDDGYIGRCFQCSLRYTGGAKLLRRHAGAGGDRCLPASTPGAMLDPGRARVR
jgi:predicted dehydrogenase